MDISTELAELGTQLQQALLGAYHAKAGAQTVLAFQPEIAVPATLVQQNQVNPLQLSTWLQLVADTPLLLQTDQTAVIGGPSGTLDHMSQLYRDLVQFATPVAKPGTAEATRVAEEIVAARNMVGDGGDLPLGTSPLDWPLPNPGYWTRFTYSQSDSSTGSTGSQGAGQVIKPLRIWTLYQVKDPTVITGPPVDKTVNLDTQKITDLGTRKVLTQPAETPALQPRDAELARTTPIGDVSATSSISTATLGIGTATLGSVLGHRPVVLHFPPPWTEPPPPPPVTTLATRLSLDHMMVMVDRSQWWHHDIVEDPGWYVAGLRKGAWVDVPPAANTVYALPVALLLVQNLTLNGSWSSAETTTLTTPGMMLGPFHLGGASVSSQSDGSVSISVPGMHLAGLFCQPLPVLPPNDPPAANS
jgi:hypothetical protein